MYQLRSSKNLNHPTTLRSSISIAQTKATVSRNFQGDQRDEESTWVNSGDDYSKKFEEDSIFAIVYQKHSRTSSWWSLAWTVAHGLIRFQYRDNAFLQI